MPGLGRHLRRRLKDNRPIAETPEERRIVARVVLHQGRSDDLIVFGQPDDHLHAYARCRKRAASRLAQRIEASLKQRLHLPHGFEPAWNKPLRDGWHPFHLTRYILTQHPHHGVVTDPGRESTNLPDLLGLRTLGQYTTLNVRRWICRLRRHHLLEWLGIPALAPHRGHPELLLQATLAASALPALRGRSADVVAVRRAMVQVAGPHPTTAELSSLMTVSTRAVRMLRNQSANPELVHAIRLQLDLARQIEVGCGPDRPTDSEFAK